MIVSLNWLTDYVDVSAMPAAELGELLTRIGICCDGIDRTESDVLFDLEITSNRPDCLGHIGVAREIAAATGKPLQLPDLGGVPEAPPPAGELTDVAVPAADLCGRYTARVVRGVKVAPSPGWLIDRLAGAGLRGVNNVVDVTNYVLLEYGQPLHAFDYDLLAEHRIVVRRGRRGEEIVSIDGTRCTLTEEMLVIADAEKPVAVAGIMGGVESEINAKTVNLLIESAQFDPLATRRAARALALMTESSYRFERGVDPVAVDAASLRACQLILQTAGGRLAQGLVDVWADPYQPPLVTLRTRRCRDLLGVDVDDKTQAGILRRLGLAPRLAGGKITCRIPPWRGDLRREVDLIEEVARLEGYEKIPLHDRVAHGVGPVSVEERARRRLRGALSAAGLDEAITYGFIDDAEAGMFGFAGGVRVDPAARRSNNLLRPTLLPSLLAACKRNQDAGNADVGLYELAAVFPPAGDDALPAEYTQLALLAGRDLRELRAALEAAADEVAPGAKLEVVPAAVGGLARDASAEVRLDGECVGAVGRIAPEVLDAYGLDGPLSAATIRFDALLQRAGNLPAYRPLPRFPPVSRDLAVVLDEHLPWSRLEQAIRSAHQPRLEAVEYVTTYRGRQVPCGKKSVTVSLTYRSGEGTLRSEEVEAMVAEVVAAVSGALGAALRE